MLVHLLHTTKAYILSIRVLKTSFFVKFLQIFFITILFICLFNVM